MDTISKRQKLHDYIEVAEDDKVNALYVILKADMEERYEWWNDEEVMAGLDQSEADFRSGKDPGTTWGALKADLLSRREKNAN